MRSEGAWRGSPWCGSGCHTFRWLQGRGAHRRLNVATRTNTSSFSKIPCFATPLELLRCREGMTRHKAEVQGWKTPPRDDFSTTPFSAIPQEVAMAPTQGLPR